MLILNSKISDLKIRSLCKKIISGEKDKEVKIHILRFCFSKHVEVAMNFASIYRGVARRLSSCFPTFPNSKF